MMETEVYSGPFGGAEPKPDAAERLLEQGVRLQRAGQVREALGVYADMLRTDPDETSALVNMGAAFRAECCSHAACACLSRAVSLFPRDALALSNLGNSFRQLNLVDEAMDCFQRALMLDPDFAMARYNYALALHAKGLPHEALGEYDRARKLDPGLPKIDWDRSLTNLLAGNFATGFSLYDARWNLEEIKEPDFNIPRWKGEDIAGKKLLVWAEQGFGDSLMFSRYLPLVAERGAEIIFHVQPQLVRLMKSLDGVTHVLPLNEPVPMPDVQIPLLSLPDVLGTTLESIPADVPYLEAPREAGFPLRVPSGTRCKIGIVWAGERKHKNDHNRSIPFEYLLELASIPGVALYSLQMGTAGQDVKTFSLAPQVSDVTPAIQDFGDTAKVIGQLDLLVSVDTSVVHLAGALGADVWTLLPHTPDWRWMLDRTDSPWYPSMRLFRQPSPGDWESVISDVVTALKGRLQNCDSQISQISPKGRIGRKGWNGRERTS